MAYVPIFLNTCVQSVLVREPRVSARFRVLAKSRVVSARPRAHFATSLSRRISARCMFSSGRSFAHFHEEADTPLATTTAAVELSVAKKNSRSFERAAQPTQGNVSLHGQNREPLRCCVIWSVPVICGFAIGSAVSL
eukprot:scaffold58606_cov64-Phaeocystis_antarctica.AAC.2